MAGLNMIVFLLGQVDPESNQHVSRL